MLYIIDLDGRKKEVTDHDKAIEQAENIKDMHHIPPVESDMERQKYWHDIYEKLIQLKTTENEQSCR